MNISFITKLLNRIKDNTPFVFKVLKKEYVSSLLLIVFGISVIWLGGMVAVIGSRDIVKPILISISDINGKELPSVRVFVKLARENNAALMRNNLDHKEQWAIDKVFVGKIMIGATDSELLRISKIGITIGEKNFSYSSTHELLKWNHFDKSIVKPYIRDADYSDYIIAEVPSDIRLETSAIPFRKTFFSSLVNWGGDSDVFIKPLTRSFDSIIIYILLFFIIKVILIIHKNRGSEIDRDNNDIDADYKRKYIIFFLIIISSVVTLAIVNAVIYYFYKPDIASILKDASSIYLNYQLPAFLPKPLERLQYVLSVFLSPFIITLFYYIYKDKLTKTKISLINFIYSRLPIITMCLLFFATYLGLAMSDFLYIKTSYYFDSMGRYIFDLIIFPALLYIFLLRGDLLERFQKPIQNIFKFTIFLTIVLLLSMNIIDLASSFSAYHFNPIFYPLSQVVAGKILLVNVTSLYGLFPIFLAPLFNIIGLSVFKFTLVIGIILSASYIFLFLFMKKVVKNYILLYSGFLSMIFYTYLTQSPTSPAFYFQYWPIRFLFPALLLFLVSLYLRSEKRYLYYVTFILSSLAILWNFDSGIIVFLAWIIILTYHEFSKESGVGLRLIKVGEHILNSIIILAGVILLFFAYTYFISGTFPNFSLFLQYQKLFLSGYFMIPMLPPPHAWNLVVLTYLVGLGLSIIALITHKITYRDKLIFSLSILGLGLFSYFEGRSHDLTLFAPSYLAFILIAIFADSLYENIRKNDIKGQGAALIFAFLFFIIISVPFSMVYSIKTYIRYVSNGATSFMPQGETIYSRNINFIKKYVHRNEKIFILSPHNESIYYAETSTYSTVDIPSSTDLFFRREADMIVEFLETNDTKKVFVDSPISFYDLYDARIKKVLEEDYTIASSSKDGLLYLKKK